MRRLLQISSSPRLWRYTAIGATFFALGGLGVAEASNLGITQVAFSSGSGTNVAHVDASGNLQVGGKVAVANLPATQPVSGTVEVGNQLGIAGPVDTRARTAQIAFEGFTLEPTQPQLESIDLGPYDTSAYRDLTMIVHSQNSQLDITVTAVSPTDGGITLFSGSNGGADTFVKQLPDVPGIRVSISDHDTSTPGGPAEVMLVGRTG
jgi:hypothetical protein